MEIAKAQREAGRMQFLEDGRAFRAHVSGAITIYADPAPENPPKLWKSSAREAMDMGFLPAM